MPEDDADPTIYKVVINIEDQYSIWPAHRANPAGWRDAGKSGPKAECLAYIEEVWTDMRPRSLRERMEGRKALETAAAGSPNGVGEGHQGSAVDGNG